MCFSIEKGYNVDWKGNNQYHDGSVIKITDQVPPSVYEISSHNLGTKGGSTYCGTLCFYALSYWFKKIQYGSELFKLD